MDEQIKCMKCGKSFSTIGNLRRHIKKFHKNDMLLAPKTYKCKEKYSFNCRCGKNFNKKRHYVYHLKTHELKGSINLQTDDHLSGFEECHNDLSVSPKIYKTKENYVYNCNCEKNFNHRRHYLYHLKMHKSDSELQSVEQVRKSKKCPICDFSDCFKKNLINHLEEVHETEIKKYSVEFLSKESFQKWKEKTEKNTNMSFVKKYTVSSSQGVTISYECSRSGQYIAKNKKRLRSLKSQGTNKINAYCPASIKLTIKNDGKCVIDFIETHVGHTNDLEHLFLSSTERQEMAGKIALKIPFNVILDEVRNSVKKSDMTRIHLLTRKDLHNIKQSFNICPDFVQQSTDYIKVEALVNEMENEGICILFYKPQNIVTKKHPQLKSNDFMIIIMSQPQCYMLNKHGHDCICLDRTHRLNKYNIEVITLLVLDDTRQSFPCSFCITNRTDEETLKIFFSYIEKYTDKISTAVFMSDMEESFFKAWVEVMDKPKLRLFCIWHVDDAWCNHLLKIRTKEKQVAVYKQLRTLLEERDQAAFEKIIKQFCQEVISDPETEEFGLYFVNNYTKNYKSWAYCYRLHMGLNTSVYLERVHGEYIYLNNKNLKRLHKLTYAFMKLIREHFFHELIANKRKITCLKDIKYRHNTSLNLDMNLIQIDNGWQVKSFSSNNEVYFIKEVNGNCQCQLICDCCNICIHRYSCSCVDSVIKWVMCKHIHLLCKFREENDLTDQEQDEDGEYQQLFIEVDNEVTNGSEYLDTVFSQYPKCEDNELEICREKEKIKQHFLKILEETNTLAELELLKRKLVL